MWKVKLCCCLIVITFLICKVYKRFRDLPDVEKNKKQTLTDCNTETETDSSTDPISEYITREMQASISCNTFDHSRDKFDKNLNSFSCNLDGIISELTELSRTFDSVSHTLNRLLTPDIADIPDSSTSDIPDIPESQSSSAGTLVSVSTQEITSKSDSIATSSISQILSCTAPLAKPDRFLRYSISSTSNEYLRTISAFNLFKSDILRMS